MIKYIISIGLFLSIGLSATAFAEDNIPDRKMRLHMGFDHWYSDSFRTADTGFKTGLDEDIFSLGMNYPLPISWTEFLLRYEYATIKADPAQKDFSEFNDKRINFVTTGFALTKILNAESQTVALSVMPVGLLWVKVNGHSESIGTSQGFNIDWLFDGRTGMFLDTRYQHYQLRRSDGSWMDTQNDVSVVVGVATRL
jgi:hypothetical protein